MALSKHSGGHNNKRCKEIICNITEFCIEEREHLMTIGEDGDSCSLVPPAQVMKRVSLMTGVSERTVSRIMQEKRTGGLKSPEKNDSRRSKLAKIDDFDICAVKRLVYTMYRSGDLVTLDSVLRRVEEEIELDISRSTLRKLLLQNGFKFRRVDKRKILMEKPSVAAARARYLRAIRKVRTTQPQRTIIYLDETWFNQNDMATQVWIDEEQVCGQKTVIGKGRRLIVVHAGSATGFVNGALLTVWTDGRSADYHDNMNAQLFEEWFGDLMKKIPANSVIIMDNASYHSRQTNRPPNTSSKKAELQAWLTEHNISFSEDMLKPELLELVRRHAPEKTYFIDELAREHGHEVLRLAPYNCDLNPIEMIWSQMKQYVRKRNRTGHLETVRSLISEAVQNIPPSTWASCCEHVVQLEQEYWHREHVMEEIDSFIVPLASSDDDSSDDEEAEAV